MPCCVVTRPYQWPEPYYQVPVSGTYPQSYMRMPVNGTTPAQCIPTVYPQTTVYPLAYQLPQTYQYVQAVQPTANRNPQLWYQAYVS
ncbi:hypothetical protein KVR01_005135 [Diaporthe batatas]|uniref:uncharacterized protein n=1 Tax=Diaporthe batatas TaxID=748121 RepID=UPI001D052F62|nr:uncharacterized protein KVR01_005135 [Diaporthe batatas]KAG8164860.1 hypothetical protein KVR01_005135 [Diaporthe batatas]